MDPTAPMRSQAPNFSTNSVGVLHACTTKAHAGSITSCTGPYGTCALHDLLRKRFQVLIPQAVAAQPRSGCEHKP